MRCKNGFAKYKSGGLPQGYRDVKFNVAFAINDSLGIVGELQVIFAPMLKNKKENHEFIRVILVLSKCASATCDGRQPCGCSEDDFYAIRAC